MTRLAWSQFWLVVANAVAGGITVIVELNPWMVALHFVLAIGLLDDGDADLAPGAPERRGRPAVRHRRAAARVRSPGPSPSSTLGARGRRDHGVGLRPALRRLVRRAAHGPRLDHHHARPRRPRRGRPRARDRAAVRAGRLDGWRARAPPRARLPDRVRRPGRDRGSPGAHRHPRSARRPPPARGRPRLGGRHPGAARRRHRDSSGRRRSRVPRPALHSPRSGPPCRINGLRSTVRRAVDGVPSSDSD